jgi:hypothetical protein
MRLRSLRQAGAMVEYRLGGVPDGKASQGWRDLSNTATVGAGKLGSAKLPIATAMYSGKPWPSQYTVEPHVGQK